MLLVTKSLVAKSKLAMKFLAGFNKSNDGQLGAADDLSREMTITTTGEVTDLSYLLYKRRWYGVLILTVINLMTSWAVRNTPWNPHMLAAIHSVLSN